MHPPLPLIVVRILQRSLALPAIIFWAGPLSAQQGSNLPYIDISKEHVADSISAKMATAYLSKDSSLDQSYSRLHFVNGPFEKGNVNNINVSKKAIVLFRITNTGDTIKGSWFFPGFFFNEINLYKEDNGHLTPLPGILPAVPDSIGYRYIQLAAHDSATIVAEMTMEKTYNNAVRPKLINPIYLWAYIDQLHASSHDLDLMTYIICGLFLMMLLFSLANFISGGNRDFLYYSIYACLLGLMLFTKSFYNNRALNASYFMESYLDFIMQGAAIIFYMIFMKKFLDAKQTHPFLYKLYNYGIILLVIALVLNTYYHFFTSNFKAENDTEFYTKIILLLIIVPVFIVYSFTKWKDKLLRYLLLGNLAQFIFSLLSLYLIVSGAKFRSVPFIINSALFYYEISLLLELVFFLMGLSYKNKMQIIDQTREKERLKAENQRKEYEKELAVFKAQQQERNRISADMHDELGSGLTAIRLMSEIAKNKMKEETPKEIDRISNSADDVLNKMNAIIWSMNSGNDSVDNLISYIRQYATEYLDGTSVHCTINTPPLVKSLELSGDKRRNIFLCVKETLNNTLKHSKASEVKIDFEVNHSLVINISDNGIGIDLQNLRMFGNGIQNVRRRMEAIGGGVKIANNNGTMTTLFLPLH
jgi:signal transduction histidine kinase